jgi:hypothetical protein
MEQDNKFTIDDDTFQIIERQLLAASITSTSFLASLMGVWKSKYIKSHLVRLIMSWVFEYFQKYGEAPAKDMERILIDKVHNKALPDEDLEDVATYLDNLSKDTETENTFNEAYLLDRVKEYFLKSQIELSMELTNELIADQEYTKAQEELINLGARIGEDTGNVVPLMMDDRGIRNSLSDTSEPLFSMPGTLGRMMNNQLTRDAFVALMGPEKRGKTFWLMELAFRAFLHNRFVIFFQAGDMSTNQFNRRFYSRITHTPFLKKYAGPYYGLIKDCIMGQRGLCKTHRKSRLEGVDNTLELDRTTLEQIYSMNPDYAICPFQDRCKSFRGGIWLEPVPETEVTSVELVKEKMTKLRKYHSMNRLQLRTYPAGVLTVSEIRAQLRLLQVKGWYPDVVLVDYADIMGDNNNLPDKDFRHRNNERWVGLRGLSQEYHCLVLTATQAAATSYAKRTITLSDFSEDKRKYGHVTAFYSLNQTAQEKELGLMRIGELIVREGEYEHGNTVTVIQRLRRGLPCWDTF